MSDRGRRAGRSHRAFRPGQELGSTGRLALEARLLLSTVSIFKAQKRMVPAPEPYIQSFVAFGGKKAKIIDTDGEGYDIEVIGKGHVRVTPMKHGLAKVTLYGTDTATVVAINPGKPYAGRGTAHTFPTGLSHVDGLLHIGNIDIKTGQIGQILGYRTADLSGTITAKATTAVDRIAFFRLNPGAGIVTGGDLNTLDVYSDLNIGGGPGITVGRDLNWLNIPGSLNIGSGSAFTVKRDLGLAPQAAKGNASGGQGALIQGDMNVANGGSFNIGRSLDAPFIVQGNLSGGANVFVPSGVQFFAVRGQLNA